MMMMMMMMMMMVVVVVVIVIINGYHRSITGNVLAVSSADQQVTLWKQGLDGVWVRVSTTTTTTITTTYPPSPLSSIRCQTSQEPRMGPSSITTTTTTTTTTTAAATKLMMVVTGEGGERGIVAGGSRAMTHRFW